MDPSWQRSSFSAGEDRLEWCDDAGTIRVRDSTDPAVELTFTRSEWAAFLADVRAGEADL